MQVQATFNNEACLLSREHAARFLLISTRNLDYLREAGKLPFVRIGRRVGFLRQDLEQFVEARRVQST
jgi:excisionase family DNA binding protein